MTKPQPKPLFLYFIFFASGFAGLIYESIWSHYLKLFLGHAAYAQTLVLAIFMGGMAIGAGLAARFTGRIGNPLLGYAAVEAVIGLCAIVFHAVYVSSTEGFYTLAADWGLSGASFSAGKWGLATMLILPQSILLGTTFPLFAAAATRAMPDATGRSIATLYFTNSLGGAIGVLMSGFALIPALGLPGTVAAAGSVNLIIAAIAARLAAPSTVPAAPAALSETPLGLNRTVWLMLAVSFLTGASSFIYEVGWIRMLSLVLGSATHSFELMLSSFILGLALGGLWIRKRVDSTRNPGVLLGQIQIAMGLAAVATLPLHSLTFDIVAYAVSSLPKTEGGYTAFNLIRYGIASLIMFPAAFCAGMTLPVATRLLYALPGQGERAIGLIYSANTVGAIVGIAFAVHIGFPVLGIDYLVATGALIDVLLGGVLLIVFAHRSRLRQIAAATLACIGGTALGAASFNPQKLASGVFRSGNAETTGSIIEIADGKTASIAVERTDDVLTIRTNGKADAAAYTIAGPKYAPDEITMTLLGAIPLMLHPTPQRVANIGFGSGMTAATVLDDPRVERLDTIEIEPEMPRLARHFGKLNQIVFNDPRSWIHIDDAKSYFASDANRRYDIIISEPSNPWVSGVASLFSLEFYQHVKRYLEKGGLFAQWLQIYEIDADRAASVLKALDRAFDHYVVIALDHGDLLIVARDGDSIEMAESAFDSLSPALQSRLRRIEVQNQSDLAFRFLGNRELFKPWLDRLRVPANSDYAPFLDTHADRDRFMGRTWQEVFNLGMAGYPIAELLGNRPSLGSPACFTFNIHFATGPRMALGQNLLSFLYPTVPATLQCPEVTMQNRMAVEAARDLLNACIHPPAGDVGYGAAGLAGRALPFLSPAERLALMDAGRNWTCLSPQAGGDEWRKLLNALATQNAAHIGESATRLLSTGHGATPARARYLLTIAMLGHIVADRPEAARNVWDRFGARIIANDPPGLILDILRAHAAAN